MSFPSPKIYGFKQSKFKWNFEKVIGFLVMSAQCNTHTFSSHTHSRTLSQTRTFSLSLFLSCSLSHTRTHSLTLFGIPLVPPIQFLFDTVRFLQKSIGFKPKQLYPREVITTQFENFSKMILSFFNSISLLLVVVGS